MKINVKIWPCKAIFPSIKTTNEKRTQAPTTSPPHVPCLLSLWTHPLILTRFPLCSFPSRILMHVGAGRLLSSVITTFLASSMAFALFSASSFSFLSRASIFLHSWNGCHYFGWLFQIKEHGHLGKFFLETNDTEIHNLWNNFLTMNLKMEKHLWYQTLDSYSQKTISPISLHIKDLATITSKPQLKSIYLVMPVIAIIRN